MKPKGKIWLIFFGCRSASLSLPHITLTHIPAVVILFTITTVYHYGQENLHKSTPSIKRTLLSFEVKCSKARKLLCRLHSHPSSHGQIMVGPLTASLKAIFSFLRPNSFRQRVVAIVRINKLDWQTGIWFPPLTVKCLSLGLVCLQVIHTQNYEYFYVSLTLTQPVVWWQWKSLDKSLMLASCSEHLKGEMIIASSVALSPVLQVKAITPNLQRQTETQKMDQQ